MGSFISLSDLNLKAYFTGCVCNDSVAAAV